MKTLWYTPKLCLCFYSVQNDINSLFYLAQIAAILHFTHDAMCKVLSYYITMSGITEACMLDTKTKNLRLFYRKKYHQDRLVSTQKNLMLLSAQYCFA